MMLILFIFATAVYFAISLHLRIKRQELYNKIDLLYTKIELDIIKSGMQITPNIQKFLASKKALYLNKEAIDFEFLLKRLRVIPKKELEKLSKLFAHVEKKLPVETNKLGHEFDKTINKMIIYNSLSTTVILFLIVEILPIVIKIALYSGIGRIRKILNMIKENEAEIAAKSFGIA